MTYILLLNCALKLVEEIILYYDARSKKHQKTICFGCTGRTTVVRIFSYSFVCLRCIVSISMHYRLRLIRIRVKVLQNRRSVRFSNRTDGWWNSAGTLENKLAFH